MTDTQQLLAAAMRAEVDADQSVYAVANRWATDSLHVHLSRNGCDWRVELSDLSRNGCDWRVELSDEPPLAADEAHAWAAALGAPEGTPVLGAYEGRVYVAQWEDSDHEPAPEVPGVRVWGGA